VHVTVKLLPGLPSLRRSAEYAALRQAFADGGNRPAFRLVQYSVQRDHLHLIVEAADRMALSRAMQGLSIRIAKALNRLWRRGGTVFADRYHEHPLKSPREVRRALCYVLHNSRRHGRRTPQPVDMYSSGPWFDGWSESFTVRSLPARPVAEARTWLLHRGWRTHGLLSIHEAPAGGLPEPD
jgi:REP element-mobilizing transposase RayT